MLGEIRRILIIKLRYIGDVLLATPVLKNLRLSFPNARLDILVNAGTEEIIKHNWDIDEIILIERGSFVRQLTFIRNLRRRNYDLVIDLTDSDRSAIINYLSRAPIRVGYNSEHRWRGICYTHVIRANRNKMHTVDYHLELLHALNISVKSSELVLQLSQQDEDYVDKIFTEYNLNDGKPIILFHPGARWWFKSWPPEYFAKLADVIQQDLKCHVIFAGSLLDQKTMGKIQNLIQSRYISLVGRTTVLQLAALLKRCRLFIGNDNGMMHVATAVGTPVVAFFGLTNPLLWGPRGSAHKVFYKEIDCSPCFPKGCVRGDQSCMRLITTDEVYDVVRGMLQPPVKCGG